MIPNTTIPSGFRELENFLVGFDRYPTIQNSLFPPHNIVKTGETTYAIELAVAGYKVDDIDIIQDKNMLSISSKKLPDNTKTYIHKGISEKSFEKKFVLNEHVIVKGATFTDGILSVNLEHIVPENLKPRKIQINSTVAEQLLVDRFFGKE